MNWTLINALMDKYNRRVSREINNWKCGCSSILSNFPASHFRFQQINFVVRKSIAGLSSGLNRFHCPLKPNQFVHPTAEEVHYFTKETTPARSNYDERLISMQCTRQFLYLYSLSAEQINSRDFFLRQIPRCPASEHHFVHYINQSLLCCGLI